MNYELAKKMKDSDFPQKHRHDEDAEGTFKMQPGDPLGRLVYVPSLSELIEACGDKFRGLNSVWYTTGKVDWDANDKDGTTCTGSTPEEAVARLWLTLNS